MSQPTLVKTSNGDKSLIHIWSAVTPLH